MNKTSRTIMTLVAVVLTLGLFSLAQSVSAQSTRGLFRLRGNSASSTSVPPTNSNCQKLKGIRTDVFDSSAGGSLGTISNGGWLNGRSETLINLDAGFVFTPDPNVIAFLSDTTITTPTDGKLKAGLVTTFNFATGVFTEWGTINPNTSTGRFAGAIGVIFFNGKTIDNVDIGPFESEITGEICFAP